VRYLLRGSFAALEIARTNQHGAAMLDELFFAI
jgi:hypothetical protein